MWTSIVAAAALAVASSAAPAGSLRGAGSWDNSTRARRAATPSCSSDLDLDLVCRTVYPGSPGCTAVPDGTGGDCWGCTCGALDAEQFFSTVRSLYSVPGLDCCAANSCDGNGCTPCFSWTSAPCPDQPLPLQYCVDIVTGTSGSNDGTLDVVIQSRRMGRGSLRELSGGYYRKGATVLQECFSEDFEVLVQNPTSNAWTGSIRLSTNGGSNYFPGLCTTCTGRSGPAFQIVVDGNVDSGDQAPVACFNGRQCVVVPSVLFASALAQAAPTGPLAACEMLSTNASAPSQCPDTPLFNQAYECIYNTKCLTGSEAGCVERTGCQYVY